MSTALKTIHISLTPPDFLRLARTLDEDGAPFGLSVVGVGADYALVSVHVDGNPTVHCIRLAADGTWTASTHIEV